MRIRRIVLPVLIFTLIVGCESIDKLKRTEAIIRQIDAKKDGTFSMEGTIEDDHSTLSVTLRQDTTYQAYYTGALYEIIIALHRNKIVFDEYTIKNGGGQTVWSVKDSEIDQITKTIDRSKKLMRLLENKEYEKFLALSNLEASGVSDTAFIAQLAAKPVYPNTEYKGFSELQQEVAGVKKNFLYIYFLNEKLEENLIVVSPDDKLAYGLQY